MADMGHVRGRQAVMFRRVSLVALVAGGVVMATAAVAPGEAGMGNGVDLRLPMHFLLKPEVSGSVVSETYPYRYVAHGHFAVAGKTVARVSLQGNATPTPQKVVLTISRAKRDAIRAAARAHPKRKVVYDMWLTSYFEHQSSPVGTDYTRRYVRIR
jgi:hypothetical protein